MKPSIFIAASDNGSMSFKKDVARAYEKTLNSKKHDLKYFIHSLIYKSFSDIKRSIQSKIKQDNYNFIIFLDDPGLSIEQLKILKSKICVFIVYEDIPEHFNTFYKYSQFLFDGLIVEPEYRNFFEVYGRPTYRNQYSNEIANILNDKNSYESLIPFQERLYDFSFVGRFDRPNRLDLINQLKEKFPNIFFHDSSKSFIPNKELKEIIRNTRYLMNSTSIQTRDSYGFRIFPEYKQLQRKSRIFEYANNGSIIFSEILSEREYSTFNNKVIPVKEIPPGANVGDFCFEYLNNKSVDILELSKKTFLSVSESYNYKSLDKSLCEILDDLIMKYPKLANVNFATKEIDLIHTNYLVYFLYKKFIEIYKTKVSWLKKVKNYFLFLKIQTYKIKKKTILKVIFKITTIFLRKFLFKIIKN